MARRTFADEGVEGGEEERREEKHAEEEEGIGLHHQVLVRRRHRVMTLEHGRNCSTPRKRRVQSTDHRGEGGKARKAAWGGGLRTPDDEGQNGGDGQEDERGEVGKEDGSVVPRVQTVDDVGKKWGLMRASHREGTA